jgi:hypothetical protein
VPDGRERVDVRLRLAEDRPLEGTKLMPFVPSCRALAIAGALALAGSSATAQTDGPRRPPVVRHAPPACNGVSGLYDGGSTIHVARDGRSVQVMVSPRRPLVFGTCRGDRITVTFRDGRVISGVFDGRTLAWDDGSRWTKR